MKLRNKGMLAKQKGQADWMAIVRARTIIL
jgi:hypothetical protein